MKLTDSIRFFKRYLNDPHSVGAIAPSSIGLARALCDPYRRCDRPARVFEIGAGTGSITREIGRVLGPADRVDICELNPVFGDILENDVLSSPDFRDPVADGRVRLLRQPVQEIADVEPYDFIVSGLPFTAFELKDVEDIFEVIRRCLKPSGVFSYFEYVGLRRTSAALSWGRNRSRVRSVSSFMTRTIKKHEFARCTVFRNLPPAYARHLRFTENGYAAQPA